MGHSRADKAESRERIITLAAQIIRERGIDAIGIADLMKAAGLTHGAFYVHFASRDALVAAALERALQNGEAKVVAANLGGAKRSVKTFINGYLSRAHRDQPGTGCAVSALSADVARSGDLTREIMMGQLERYFDNLADASGAAASEAAEEFALGAWSTMVGAIILARVFAGTSKADQILMAARRFILDRESQLAS